MLLVLSEFDCLKTLNAKGVYPDRLYTDFDLLWSPLLSLVLEGIDSGTRDDAEGLSHYLHYSWCF